MNGTPRPFDPLAAALLALVPLVFFRDSVFGGGALFDRDIHLLWHGQVEGFVRDVAAGSWPAWDPWIGFGQPLLANPNTQVYYPPTWLNLLMRPWTYYTVYVVAHLAWAGLGMLVLARALGVSRPGARVASLVWMASGPLISLASMWNHFAGAAWMPWVIAAAVRFRDEASPRRAAALGLAVAVQFLAGSPDMSAYTGLAAAAFVLSGMVATRAQPRDAGRLALLAGGAALLAAALSAAQWMPTVALLRGSARMALDDGSRTYWSIHPLGALELLFPGFWRDMHVTEAGRAALTESREPFLASIYLGLPALGLVLASFAGPRRRFVMMAGLGAGAVLIALGRHAPFYDAALVLFPILRLSRFPAKALPLAAMAWACLAGAGFDVWRDGDARPRRPWALIAAVLAGTIASALLAAWLLPSVLPSIVDAKAPPGFPGYGVAAILGVATAMLAILRAVQPRHAAVLAMGVASIAACDLVAFHRNINPGAPRALYAHRPPVVDALSAAGRVYVRATGPTPAAPVDATVRMPAGWSAPATLALDQQMGLDSLAAARWGLRGSFTVDYMSLQPRYVVELGSLLRLTAGTPAYDRLLRVCGVTHVVTRDQGAIGALEPVASFAGLLLPPIRVLAVASPVPRIAVVGAARAIDGPWPLVDERFDPRREVLLAEGPDAPGDPRFDGRVETKSERPDAMVVDVRLSHPGYLVVLDTFDPAWRARVDGEKAEVRRANHAFRAVAVPAGRHRVDLEYRPGAVRGGIMVSLATAVAAAAVSLWWSRRAP